MEFTVKYSGGARNYKTLQNAKKFVEREGGVILQDGRQIYPVTETHATKNYQVIVKVNVRDEPSLEARRIGVLEMGSSVQIIQEIDENWLRLCWNNGTAYARHNKHAYIRPKF